MTRRHTDFRALKARRDAAMARPELRDVEIKSVPLDAAAIETAMKEGRYRKLPPKKRRHP
jgi:hypothetical protein